jgi:hypothetical protein
MCQREERREDGDEKEGPARGRKMEKMERR